jgi:RNA polymerase sigma factor (sigma-70 family)
MPDDDAQLLLRTIRGDDAAARLLWARHGPRLTAFAVGMTRGDRASADDAVQTAFLGVLSLDGRGTREIRDVGAFLAAATRNAVLNQRRTRARATARENVAARPEHTDRTDDETLDAALATLPDDVHDVMLLRHAAGLTFDQIALCLSEAKSTVVSRHARGLDLLRQAISPATINRMPHVPTHAPHPTDPQPSKGAGP